MAAESNRVEPESEERQFGQNSANKRALKLSEVNGGAKEAYKVTKKDSTRQAYEAQT